MNSTEKKLITARSNMLFKAPFFGNLAIRLRLIDASKWLDTCATDGRHFYYNRDFVEKLSRPELIFVFCHQVMHCVYEHMSRRGSRNADFWDAACDFISNADIVEQNIGRMPTVIDKDGKKLAALYNEKYQGLATEQVYDLLMKEFKGDPGKLAAGAGESFDLHASDLEKMQGDPSGENGPIPLSEDDVEEIKDEMKQAVMQAAKSAQNAGQVPANVRRMISELTDPKMDWRELLSQHIQSALKDDFTFMKRSRKSMTSSIYLPGMKNAEKIEVDIAIDTSGSMSDHMLRDIVSEVHGIMCQFDDFTLRIWCFDTEVHERSVMVFTPDNIDEIHTYKLHGGGGTIFTVNWDWMKAKDIMPHRFVMFTDGYPYGSWGDENYCDTLFVIHGDGGKNIVAPFGLTAYYEDAK